MACSRVEACTPPVPPPDALLASESSNISLVVLMGLPASGKTTLANKLWQFCKEWRTIMVSFDAFVPLSIQAEISQQEIDAAAANNANYISRAKNLRKKFISCVDTIVSFSKVQETCNGKDSKNANVNTSLILLETLLSTFEPLDCISNQSFVSKTKEIIVSYSSLLGAGNGTEHCNTVILVDDNNYYRSMRNDFYQIAKLSEIGFCIIYCKALLKICLERNSHRLVEAQVPSKAIVEMGLKFEEPNPLQNNFDTYCIQIDTGDSTAEANLQLVEKIIFSSFSNPLKTNVDRTVEIERERRICSENEIHQADLLLRKWIGKKINLASISGMMSRCANGSGNKTKNISKELNSRKKATLDGLKTGQLQVSYEVHQDVEFRDEIIKMFESLNLE